MRRLVLVPVTTKAARRELSPVAARGWVEQVHRHLPRLGGWRFAVGLRLREVLGVEGPLVGIGVCGNGPRAWEGEPVMVITRVATNGTPNACSKLYGALCRAGVSLGYVEAWTYTLPEEPGTSLRAAGFEDMGLTDGGEWDRPGVRRRRAADRPEPKRRWRRVLCREAARVAAGVTR